MTAIEAGVDVAQHVCASEGWVRRGTALVHDYVEVDDGIVLDRLGNLGDLDDFVATVAAWVVPGS